MHNMLEEEFDLEATAVQPWLANPESVAEQQRSIQKLLAHKAGAKFGSNCYIAPDAKVFTYRLIMGDRSWIASGAIVRGDVEIGADCSVNPYAHIAGSVNIGRGCRIASLASIYGFNHGIQPNKFVKDQATTSRGVKLHEDIWVGANAVILDGIELGDHCIVAAGAVVTKSFPAYQVLAGNPARVIADRRDGTGDDR